MNTVLITGAARRFGLELTKYFMSVGWQVIAVSRNSSDKLDYLESDQCLIIRCDYESQESVMEMIDTVKSRYISINCIIHNASYFEIDSKDVWLQSQQFFNVHQRLPAIVNNSLLPLLRAAEEVANIIHITDIFVDHPNDNFSLYCGSKAALSNMTRAWAKKWAPNIRVNSIQPGPVSFLPSHSAAAKKKVLSETPLGGECGFMPLIKGVQYLINNPFVTGEALKIDGGRSLR